MTSAKVVQTLIVFLVAVAILFEVAAILVPTAQTAGDTLNESGVPLGALFAAGGIIFLVIMAGILLSVVRGALKGVK